MTQQKKKREENQEKKETEYKKFMQIVLPYECVKEWSRSLMKNWSRKVHLLGEGVIASAH
jgi:hypothetical protein